MKKLIFLILLLPSLCLAGSIQDAHKAVIARMNIAAAGGIDFTAYANCQGAWLFADDLTDASGEGNTLGENGSTSYTTDRPGTFSIGKSLDFVIADTDCVYLADASLGAQFPGKAQKADMSWCAWVKSDIDSADDRYLIGKGYTFFEKLSAYSDNDELGGYFSDGTESIHAYHDTDLTGVQTWVHICVSWDGSATDATVWVSSAGGSFGDITNGTVVDHAAVDFVRASDTYDFAIGCIDTESLGGFFDGHIYQPIVFDQTLTDVATGVGAASAAAAATAMYTTGITGLD